MIQKRESEEKKCLNYFRNFYSKPVSFFQGYRAKRAEKQHRSYRIRKMQNNNITIPNQSQQEQELSKSTVNTQPIFSFLESKVAQRFNDATRAKVEQKLKLEHSLRKENPNATSKAHYTIELLGQKTVDKEYVLYDIKLTKGAQQWVFRTRFSLLHNFHEKLPHNVKKQIDCFPEKRLFGNLQNEFLSRRFEKLQTYLTDLFTNQDALNSEILQDFVKQSRLGATKINDPTSVNNFSLDY